MAQPLQQKLERQAETENHNLLEQTPLQEPVLGQQNWNCNRWCATGSPWTSLRFKNSRRAWSQGSLHSFLKFTSRTTTRFSQWSWEKNPLCSCRRVGERTILKYARVFCFSQLSHLQEKNCFVNLCFGFYQSLTYLGKGKYPTPAPSTHVVHLRRRRETTEKHWWSSHSRGTGLPEDWDLIRTLEDSPSPQTLPPHY